jgi:hypothetical protein
MIHVLTGECQACDDMALCYAMVGYENFTLVMHEPESELTWNITKAWQMVEATLPRRRYTLPDDPRVVFQGGQVCEAHLAHVREDARPGLLVVMDNIQPDGTRAMLVVRVDGNHRAELARREGLPFWHYVLTEEEMQACVVSYRFEGTEVGREGMAMLPGEAPTL